MSGRLETYQREHMTPDGYPVTICSNTRDFGFQVEDKTGILIVSCQKCFCVVGRYQEIVKEKNDNGALDA